MMLQVAIAIITLIMSSLNFLMPLVPFLGRWAFAIVKWAMYLTFPGVFTIFSVAMQRAFGFKYFNSNYGLIVSGYVCTQ